MGPPSDFVVKLTVLQVKTLHYFYVKPCDPNFSHLVTIHSRYRQTTNDRQTTYYDSSRTLHCNGRLKSGCGVGLEEISKILGFYIIFLQRLKLATSNVACSWGWPRPTIKTTTRGKSGRGPGLGRLPNIWGFSSVLLQWPRCPLSVSWASYKLMHWKSDAQCL